MAVAGCLSVVAAGWLVSGCGSQHASPMVVHLDGKVTGDYVREVSATGSGFLVPTWAMAGQGMQTFDIAAPPPGKSAIVQSAPAIPAAQWNRQRWFIGPVVTGMTHGTHVELLVTGEPGRELYLGFEESCRAAGQSADTQGASGWRKMRSPAVMIVPTLQSGSNTSCYVAGTVTSRGSNSVHISLIDY